MTTGEDFRAANDVALDIDGLSRGLYSGEAHPGSDGDGASYGGDVYTACWAYRGTLDGPADGATFKARLVAVAEERNEGRD